MLENESFSGCKNNGMQVSFDSLVIYFREKTSTTLLIAAALVQELDISVPDLDWPWKPTIETFYSDRMSCRRERFIFITHDSRTREPFIKSTVMS